MSKLCSDENQNQDQKLETIYINPKILSSMNFPQNTSRLPAFTNFQHNLGKIG